MQHKKVLICYNRHLWWRNRFSCACVCLPLCMFCDSFLDLPLCMFCDSFWIVHICIRKLHYVASRNVFVGSRPMSRAIIKVISQSVISLDFNSLCDGILFACSFLFQYLGINYCYAFRKLWKNHQYVTIFQTLESP